MNEEAVFRRVNEGLLFWVPGSSWDDAVNVRVVLHLTPPRVKDAGKACDATFGLGGSDVFEGLCAALDNEAVELLGMGEAGLAKFTGEREGDHKIRHR